MKVKICGITSLEDAINAINAGADALGFVFYEKSPRYITPENAALIINELPPFVEKVALFVNATPQVINHSCHTSKATLAQIHFEVTQDFLAHLDVPFLEVIRAQSKDDVIKDANRYRLVDAYCDAYGGAGKRLNLEWFDNIDCSKIILAGGLSAENVHEVKSYGFYGVDVSSGVEYTKGKKDAQKVTQFITNAKA